MTTEGHFDAAVKGTGKTAQKAAQQAHAVSGREPQHGDAIDEKNPDLPGFAKHREMPQVVGVAVEGFEPPTRGL